MLINSAQKMPSIQGRISIEFRNHAHQLSTNILGSYLWRYLYLPTVSRLIRPQIWPRKTPEILTSNHIDEMFWSSHILSHKVVDCVTRIRLSTLNIAPLNVDKPQSTCNNMSRDMWFPTMWHFNMNRLRQAYAASFEARNSKWCSVSSLTLIEYSSNKQRLWSDCVYAQAGLRLC